jgi:hypothetical protein
MANLATQNQFGMSLDRNPRPGIPKLGRVAASNTCLCFAANKTPNFVDLDILDLDAGVPVVHGTTTAPPAKAEIEKLLEIASRFGIEIKLPERQQMRESESGRKLLGLGPVFILLALHLLLLLHFLLLLALVFIFFAAFIAHGQILSQKRTVNTPTSH